MRWDNLFDDLEGQLEQELNAEGIDLLAEEERLRLGRMSLRDRIAAIHASENRHASYSLRLQLIDGSYLTVRPATLGRDWFSADLVDDSARAAQCIVPLSAIGAVLLTRPQVRQSVSARAESNRGPELSTRLTLSFVLRDLCRRRRSLEIRLIDSTAWGTIDRVGRDHLDLAVHESGSARRESVVTQYRIIPFGQVLLLRV